MANKYTRQHIDICKVIQLYESGMTQVEVAEEIGTTQKVIFERLKAVGYKCRVAIKRNQSREKNSSWKSNSASYKAFHYRMYSLKGSPKKCEICGTDDKKKHYDWANISGKFEDPSDYKRMCRSCHWKHDKIINNIKHMKEKNLCQKR
jgi:hypothetical protein